MLDQRQLSLFVALAEEAHFAKAAERMHISQSALSRSISAMEASLRVRLFERTSRRVTLSEAGRTYLSFATRILFEFDAARVAAQRAQAGFSGIVTIGYMDLAIVSFLPGLVAEFRRANPEIEVQLRYGWSERQKEDLSAERIDVGFIVGSYPARETASVVVAEQRLVAILPARHPLASRAEISIQELANEPFIQGTKTEWRSLNDAVTALCSSHGFIPTVIQEAPTRDSIFGLVSAGLGVTVYSDVAYSVPRPEVAAVRITEADHPLQISAIWQRWRLSEAAKKFVSTLQR
ncbi:LysR family transcriptional regulator [Sinorhizobium meliloti]|uniref:LysR family transcriptional regulator n=1 Tax=Rhizobium meliloti TaxID=382 RepID=UPI003D662420